MLRKMTLAAFAAGAAIMAGCSSPVTPTQDSVNGFRPESRDYETAATSHLRAQVALVPAGDFDRDLRDAMQKNGAIVVNPDLVKAVAARPVRSSGAVVRNGGEVTVDWTEQITMDRAAKNVGMTIAINPTASVYRKLICGEIRIVDRAPVAGVEPLRRKVSLEDLPIGSVMAIPLGDKSDVVVLVQFTPGQPI